VKPQDFEVGQIEKIAYFPDIGNVVLAEIELLNAMGGTFSFWQLAKYLREDILLTLNEMTYKLGIHYIRERSSKSFPHRFRFLMFWRLSDFVLMNTSSAVSDFPTFFELI
jgi:hypothetical protein